MRDKHGINLSYNKAYRSKDNTLHIVFGDQWESFKMLPAYFHMLEKSNPGRVTKTETYRKNRFKYGFMALGAFIERFNTVIRTVIPDDATLLKSNTRGVLLVVVCKDGNEIIYPLAFGFANSECAKLWTWFLTKLREVILCLELLMIVSDRCTGISNGMKAIFRDAAQGVCAYQLAKNLKQHCRKRGDVINLYYRATYVYRVEEFGRLMAELPQLRLMPRKRYGPRKRTEIQLEYLLQHWFHDRRSNAREMPKFLTHNADQHIKDRVLPSQRCEIHPFDCNRFKVYSKWNEEIVDLEQRSCSCREWDLDELPCIHAMVVATFKGMPISALCSDFFTIGWLKQAYAMAVNPVPKPEVWDITNAVHNCIVLLWKKMIDRKTREKSDTFC
ncbi:hypothetical protein Dsin_012420 [Dipteronia sinensis]|uniref:SWIM-type domain-containing protein n=1 Tax=Dipteronia sinensis TaxID=43782 RepID=A0AAE0AIP7_9ROSI|nr:hypothetical protein Dsin_012420 [Dipteronia sinensis]